MLTNCDNLYVCASMITCNIGIKLGCSGTFSGGPRVHELAPTGLWRWGIFKTLAELSEVLMGRGSIEIRRGFSAFSLADQPRSTATLPKSFGSFHRSLCMPHCRNSFSTIGAYRSESKRLRRSGNFSVALADCRFHSSSSRRHARSWHPVTPTVAV